jgi:hypothetical protein
MCFMAFTVLTSRAEAQNGMHGEFSILFWQPDPELTLQSGAISGATGIQDVDFVETFGIESKGFPEIRARLGRNHKFRFSFVPVKYEADTTITRTITFQGRTFNIGVPASTEIKWNLMHFGYEWDFVSMEKGYVGVIGELKYQKLEASITSPALSGPAATDQKAPVPTVGVAFRGYPIPMIGIGGEFGGLKISSSDFEAKLFDFDVNGFVQFGQWIGVQGGYRAVTIDYDIDEDSGDLKLKGPYVGAILRF